MTKKNATIAGCGLYAPEKIITNDFFDEKYQKDLSAFLVEKRNIRQRHFMASDQATSDLIIPAAQKALSAAGITAGDLDLIIVCTDTPDYISPPTSAVVQFKLGAKNAGIFDVNAACAGFVTGLDVGARYIQTNRVDKNVLVVGAYGMSKYFDWSDYKVPTVFADGAGAVVLRPATDENHGVLASAFYADGQYHDYMGIYAGGTAEPISPEVVDHRRHLLQFVKRIPTETNSVYWPKLAHQILDEIKCGVDDVRHFFLTQLNIGTILQTMELLKQNPAKSHNIMDRYGYTGSACIPMAIADACEQHRLKKDDLVVLIGSGGGMAMAALALRWSYDT